MTAWAEQNFLFGIVKGMDTGWDWLMNQFIQLRGAHYINYEYGVVDSSITFYPYAIHQLTPNMFDLCPYINKYTLLKKFIKEHYRNFFNFVKEMIDDGYYLSTFLDQFFRDDKSLDSDFRHPNFIFGYCDEENSVYIVDNFENGKYGEKTISSEDLEKAFDLVSDEIWEVSVFLYNGRILDAYQYMLEYQPKWLILQPSVAWMLCQAIKDQEKELLESVEYVELTGEYLENSIRKTGKNCFNVKPQINTEYMK